MKKEPVTQCIHGHEYTAANIKLGKDGKRRCRECALVANREFMRKVREKEKVLNKL